MGRLRFNRKPAYTRDGKPLCFNNAQYGHYQSACSNHPQPSSQPRRTLDATHKEGGAERTGAQTNNAIQLRYTIMPVWRETIVTRSCIHLLSYRMSDQMACQTSTPGQIFELPYPLPGYFSEMGVTTPNLVAYDLYKRNVAQYDVPGW